VVPDTWLVTRSLAGAYCTAMSRPHRRSLSSETQCSAWESSSRHLLISLVSNAWAWTAASQKARLDSLYPQGVVDHRRRGGQDHLITQSLASCAKAPANFCSAALRGTQADGTKPRA